MCCNDICNCCRQSACCCTPVCCGHCCPQDCPNGFFTLSGTVTGVDGFPAAGIPIDYAYNGVSASVVTGANGVYTIIIPCGLPPFSLVTIVPNIGIGVTVTPPSYTVPANCDRLGLDFTLTVV